MFRSQFRSVVAGILTFCAAWIVTPVQAQTPGKLALERLATEDCLVFVAWNGWTEPDPKSQNRVDQLLAEPSLRDFVRQLGDEFKNVVKRASRGQPDADVLVENGSLLIQSLLTKPGAMTWSKLDLTDKQPIPEISIVFDTGPDAARVKEAIDTLKELMKKSGGQYGEETVDGITFLRPKDEQIVIRLGFKDSFLIATLGEATTKATLARLASSAKPAAWLTQISKELAVERPSMLLHINAAGLLTTFQPVLADPQIANVIDALGITQLRQISLVSGLDAVAGVTKATLTTTGAPQGLFALTPNKPLTIDSLKTIPANASHASVSRFDLAHLLEQILRIADKVQPGSREQAEAALTQFAQQAGFSVQDDLLAALGDEWSYYVSGSEAGVMMVPGLVVTASVRDHAKLSKTLDIVTTNLKAVIQQFGPQSPAMLNEFESRGETGHRLTINNLPIPISPTWVLTKEQLIIGLTPQLVTSHLSAVAKSNAKSLADHEAIQAAFKRTPNPISVDFSDPKPGLQGLYTLINTFSPFVLGQLA